MRKIDPHIGDNYSKAGLRGRKILILGESSYNPKGYSASYDMSKQCTHLIEDVIGWSDYRQKGIFYSRIARIFGFDPNSKDSRIEFWSSVAYCNFLQLILKEAREVPPADAWQQGVEPFKQTLDELRPDCVVIFSKRLWSYVPKTDDLEAASDFYARKSSFHHQDAKSSMMVNFKHPSSYGFRWGKAREILAALLSDAALPAGAHMAVNVE